MKRPRIVVVAQTPPPFHGQSVMQQHLVSAPWKWCRLEHIRMQYSWTIDEVGRFSLRKLRHMASVIFRIWLARSAGPIDILYYPPAGPHRIPFLRDLFTLLCTRWTARRTVLHFHAGGFDALRTLLTPVERLMARAAYGSPALAIVPAASLSREVEWIHPATVAVIGNGVTDLPPGIPDAVHPAGRILFVGSLCAEKGVLDLLGALHALVLRGCSPVLILAGAFRSRAFGESLLELLHTEGLQPYVRLAGVLENEELMMEYSRAGIFCFPTYDTEAMPAVLLEAMRSGLPIVTTRWRSIPDIVEDAAVLVPPNDPAALAETLHRLMTSDELRHDLGRRARRRFAETFTLARHLDGMERALKAVAAE
jgi:glycosyltransferase involved in cell wall biosynthesis